MSDGIAAARSPLTRELEVGALYRGQVRKFLTEAQFKGHVESFKEIKGWLDSRFLIKGMSQTAKSAITRWMQEVSE